MRAAPGEKLLPMLRDVVVTKFVRESESFARRAGSIAGVEVAENNPMPGAKDEHSVEFPRTVVLVDDDNLLGSTNSRRRNTACEGILVCNITAQFEYFQFA